VVIIRRRLTRTASTGLAKCTTLVGPSVSNDGLTSRRRAAAYPMKFVIQKYRMSGH